MMNSLRFMGPPRWYSTLVRSSLYLRPDKIGRTDVYFGYHGFAITRSELPSLNPTLPSRLDEFKPYLPQGQFDESSGRVIPTWCEGICWHL